MFQEPSSSFQSPAAANDQSAANLDPASVLAYLNRMLGNHVDFNGVEAGVLNRGQVSEAKEIDEKYLRLALDHWASQAYAERRLRDKVFNDPEIFGEPAWDALLDIAQAEAKGERLAVTSACIGSRAPSTTGLRWLKILEERGLVRREADASDARRSFVRLTSEGRKKIERYFQEVKRLRGS